MPRRDFRKNRQKTSLFAQHFADRDVERIGLNDLRERITNEKRIDHSS